jgi:hypothetical protein
MNTSALEYWVPACAGMTGVDSASSSETNHG